MTAGSTRSLRALGTAFIIAHAAHAAAGANTDTTITACVSSDGRVRIVSLPRVQLAQKRAASPCHRGERLVTWNITGPEGPAGPSGPEGMQGQVGPAGPGLAGIQYYTVGNGDLRPVGGGFFGTSFGPFPGGTFSTAAAPLLAGIHLPQGARVLALRSHVFDNSASDLIIELFEQPLSGAAPLVIFSNETSGAAAAPYAIDNALFEPHEVDNSQFHYLVRVSPTPGWTTTSLQVLGVTVVYSLLPVPGS